MTAVIVGTHIDKRANYRQFFVGSDYEYNDLRQSDRLQRLALILGITGYWVYIAFVIAAAVGLKVDTKYSSSKCLSATWLLTAVVSLVCSTIRLSRLCVSGELDSVNYC